MIKEINNLDEALSFICKTYLETIASEDSLIGQENFINNYVYGNETRDYFNKYEKYYGYYLDKLAGVISLRNDGYIKFLFVDKSYQKKGIGKELIAYVTNLANNNNLNCLSLDSSLSNVSFYKKLGFIQINVQICIDDIWFIPMKKQI